MSTRNFMLLLSFGSFTLGALLTAGCATVPKTANGSPIEQGQLYVCRLSERDTLQCVTLDAFMDTMWTDQARRQ
jgi:hypothetical protein